MAGKYKHSISELTFKVTSTRIAEESKKYVAYTITIHNKGSAVDRPSIIERRYSDFLELYTNLRNEFPCIFSTFNFPKKVVIGNFSPETIIFRSTSFESLLLLIACHEKVKESPSVINFLQKKEQIEALSYYKESSVDCLQAVVLLENSFRLLNKLLTDRHGQVLQSLCLLVAYCEAAGDPRTPHFTKMAVHRFEGVSDTDSLRYYVPLLQLAIRQMKKEESVEGRELLEERLCGMKRRGMRVDNSPSLLEAVLSDLNVS